MTNRDRVIYMARVTTHVSSLSRVVRRFYRNTLRFVRAHAKNANPFRMSRVSNIYLQYKILYFCRTTFYLTVLKRYIPYTQIILIAFSFL